MVLTSVPSGDQHAAIVQMFNVSQNATIEAMASITRAMTRLESRIETCEEKLKDLHMPVPMEEQRPTSEAGSSTPVYGHPASHMRRGMNDTMLIQLHNWIASLKMPVLVAGDLKVLNTTTSASSYLAICQHAGIWRISPETPSTTNKFGGPADGKPIDHALVNSRFLSLGSVATIQHDICMSDHFPVTGAWNFLDTNDLPIQKWPARMNISGPIVEEVRWVRGANTYTEWAEKATRWVSDTYEVPQISKTTLTSVDKKTVPRNSSGRFKWFHRLFGLLSRARRNPEESHQRTIGDMCEKLRIEKVDDDTILESNARRAYSLHLTSRSIKMAF